MTETTVAASIMIDLLEQLERRGVPAADMCRRARVDPAFLTRPHDRIAGSWAERLWHEAEAASGDPLLGLHIAEHYRTGAISILGYIFLNCSTASDALDRLIRFAALMNDGLRVHLSRDAVTTTIRLEAVPGIDNFLLRSGRHVFETMAAGIVLTLRRLTDRPAVPSQVWFRHRVAGPVEEYHRIFGTLVRFGQSEDRLAFRNEQLDVPIPAADPALLALFEGHALTQLDGLERLGGTSQRVVRLLAARLTGTVPPVGSIAAELAMSGRQLQRVLKDEGTSYQLLLDQTRRDLALARLRIPGTTATEVALLLGYSEAGAFSRAFRRWTGGTPGAYAARAAARA